MRARLENRDVWGIEVVVRWGDVYLRLGLARACIPPDFFTHITPS